MARRELITVHIGESDDEDVCATCGCVIGDAERHAAWHRSDVSRVAELYAEQAAANEPQLPRCFGEDPTHA